MSILRPFPTVALAGRPKIHDLSPAGCWEEKKTNVRRQSRCWQGNLAVRTRSHGGGGVRLLLWSHVGPARLTPELHQFCQKTEDLHDPIWCLTHRSFFLQILLVLAACFALCHAGHQGSYLPQTPSATANSREAGGTRQRPSKHSLVCPRLGEACP